MGGGGVNATAQCRQPQTARLNTPPGCKPAASQIKNAQTLSAGCQTQAASLHMHWGTLTHSEQHTPRRTYDTTLIPTSPHTLPNTHHLGSSHFHSRLLAHHSKGSVRRLQHPLHIGKLADANNRNGHDILVDRQFVTHVLGRQTILLYDWPPPPSPHTCSCCRCRCCCCISCCCGCWRSC